ncbi:zinc finger protein OZF-like [Eupeodes corollae]|uniref:zinc finger protein OZF-like n=1 Tax=Eupeodes corollae TaxID=290404 RepID=UPI00248F8387|nr:zinc finger protein OZF-like [Eupeodes corollae]
MSVEVLNNINLNSVSIETLNELQQLEKCGEVFLERHLGNLIYVCNLCDDKFKSADGFSDHIAEIHITVENFITYEPSESDAEVETVVNKEIDPIGKSTTEQDEEYNTLDYEILMKLEENTSSESLKEELILIADGQIKEDLEEQEIKQIQKEEPTNDVPKPFEISLYEEEELQLENLSPLPEEKIKEDKEAVDPSDEEILRSKLTCKFCGEQFDYVKRMREHDCGLNKKKKKHFCSVCGKEFKKKSGLDIHSLLHKGEKPHKCDICGTAYACKQNLIVHVRRHTGEKPFKCDYCDRRFASSTERISHMRTHTGDRPFVCELCGKGHSSSSQLTEHMHRHLDIRNYACEVCDKRFRNSYNLRMHRLTHDKGPRQHQCSQCSSTFKTPSSLLQHSKIHEKVKKYVCKICGRAFAQHPGLYSHMKSHASSP